MARRPRPHCLLALVCVAPASPAIATVEVYTDPVAWHSAVMARELGHVHDLVLEGFAARGLVTGTNSFPPIFGVDIGGTPGSNAIDDSPTSPLSPNGSTYYLGDVGIGASVAPVLWFIDYPPMFQVIGFGADWVIDGDLFMEVQGTLISLGDLLPTGSGFLGIVSDERELVMVAHLSGVALFGMDEIVTGNVPELEIPWPLAAAGVALSIAARRRARHVEPSRRP
jgi:hypothetical protein